jgi:hypothetical protein
MANWKYDPPPEHITRERVGEAIAHLRPENAELRAILQETLGLITECEELESEVGEWIYWSETSRGRRGRPPMHDWSEKDFKLIEVHAAKIHEATFWPRAANFERSNADLPKWIDGLRAAGLMELYLPAEYQETALALLPKLRDDKLTFRDRQPWPLALWCAQFHIGSATLTMANCYRPASLDRLLRGYSSD